MPISVKDIQEKEFSRQKRDGYMVEEVDDFLDQIADQLSVLIRENMALYGPTCREIAAAIGAKSPPAARVATSIRTAAMPALRGRSSFSAP